MTAKWYTKREPPGATTFRGVLIHYGYYIIMCQVKQRKALEVYLLGLSIFKHRFQSYPIA